MAGGQKAWKENIRPQRMTAAELQTIQALPAKANKYGAVRTTIHGETFHSKREALHWLVLLQRERAGEIANIKRQVRYEIIVAGEHICDYVADFTYTEIRPGSGFVVVDVKGYETPEYKIKRALFRAVFGFDITEVR